MIFDDPAVHADESVTLLYGALKTTGDTYQVKLESPVRSSDPGTKLEMALGISFSYQTWGTQQYSTIDVNGRRLSTAAGGEDDGYSSNGGLITVGGLGDDRANPDSPDATPTNPRSDDELYDLRPFVADGATSITIDTSNPSNDDNVFFAAFEMNPPVTSISNNQEKFVYVALGDSYQSGEGTGYSTRGLEAYLNDVFENGSNYPNMVGPQENTYLNDTQGAGVTGNTCHRSLWNYAKLNRDKLAPNAEIILIDRTCSGATIQPGGKPAIVGTVGQDPDPDSQLMQAVNLLSAEGLTSKDVNLVTVGMGGNDARFSDIVTECVAPGLLQELLAKYPNAPGEISWITQQVTCKMLDDYVVKTGNEVNALGDKEQYALGKIAGKFESARILQLNYPNILPFKNSPAWCGGIRSKDIDFARERLLGINKQVANGVASNSRIELVDVAPLFGPNALCPSGSERQFANGFEKSKFDTEVTRLLNLNGDGDARARKLLDELVAEYQSAKSCYAKHYVPFGDDCDTSAANDKVIAKAKAVTDYLGAQQETIFGNVVSPPGTTDDTAKAAFDRSRNLFHPNRDGFEVGACAVLKTYEKSGDLSSCSSAESATYANSAPKSSSNPIAVAVRQLLNLIIGYFRPGTNVQIWMFSTPQHIGDATADADGNVHVNFTVPDVAPGIHRVEFRGEGPDGVQVTQEVLLDVAGRPNNDGYTVYLTGFQVAPEDPAEPWSPEMVDVSVGGVSIGTFQADEHGGVLVTIPVLGNPLSAEPVSITATSQSTGKKVTRTVRPVPRVSALWATDPQGPGIVISGNGVKTDGLVHSESAVAVSGGRSVLSGGAEYVSSFALSGRGSTVAPRPVQVTAGEAHLKTPVIADYRPGGSAAVAAGSAYTAVPAAACADGYWRPKPGATGVFYVPCGVQLDQSGSYPATFAAEGAIVVSSRRVSVAPAEPSVWPALVSGARGAAVTVSGNGAQIGGAVSAVEGRFEMSGKDATLRCGATARSMALSGVGSSVTVQGCVA